MLDVRSRKLRAHAKAFHALGQSGRLQVSLDHYLKLFHSLPDLFRSPTFQAAFRTQKVASSGSLETAEWFVNLLPESFKQDQKPLMALWNLLFSAQLVDAVALIHFASAFELCYENFYHVRYLDLKVASNTEPSDLEAIRQTLATYLGKEVRLRSVVQSPELLAGFEAFHASGWACYASLQSRLNRYHLLAHSPLLA